MVSHLLGTVTKDTIVKAGNLGFYNYNIVEELKLRFASAKIILRNDGKCAALAEKKIGALKDYNDCIFLNVGTGIGGAVFLNGQLLEPKKYSGC